MNAFTPIDKSPLSELEWKIVARAREDSALSLNPAGMLAQVARFFGMSVTRGLEGVRVEALRRFSVRAWHWDLIRARDVRAFLDAGYSRAHVLEILSRIGMARGFLPTIQDDAEHPSAFNGSARRSCG